MKPLCHCAASRHCTTHQASNKPCAMVPYPDPRCRVRNRVHKGSYSAGSNLASWAHGIRPVIREGQLPLAGDDSRQRHLLRDTGAPLGLGPALSSRSAGTALEMCDVDRTPDSQLAGLPCLHSCCISDSAVLPRLVHVMPLLLAQLQMQTAE